jgi:hypothetical protein
MFPCIIPRTLSPAQELSDRILACADTVAANDSKVLLLCCL